MTERDVYMTHVLHDALESLTQKKFDAARRKNSTYVQYDPQPVRIVAVIGEDHMDGIKANWGKRVDAAVIEELMRYAFEGHVLKRQTPFSLYIKYCLD